jgi:hypothetical protein
MPISLSELVAAIAPTKTCLLFGAGASVPSGAPTGKALAHQLWKTIAKSEPISDDLIETTSILCNRHGRDAVVKEIRIILRRLRPTAGLLGLPNLDWAGIYTTNFDDLVEQAYRRHKKPLAVYRSNFDFSRKEDAVGQRLYKLHGCVSEDRTLGHVSSMVLTEDDYEDYKKYRQSSFAEIQRSLNVGDVIVIGQSLADKHLQDLVKEALAAKNQGATGRIYLLVFNKDDLRAQMLENRGAKVAYGGIDDFIHALSGEASVQAVTIVETEETVLPFQLVSTARSVSDNATAPANVIRMFNGGPATYADIASDNTFERDQESQIIESIASSAVKLMAVVGAAGVGKTTFARRIAWSLQKKALTCWEHQNEFPFRAKAWQDAESDLRAAGRRAVLIVDECTNFMRGVNDLAEHLGSLSNPALQLIVTANAAQWTPRIKSKYFGRGKIVALSRLSDDELRSLLNLLDNNRNISSLVQAEFKNENRNRQFDQLRRKCSSDMFVCLKNIFAYESLDTILLQEYDGLAPALQEYYRFVAALEAVGTKVHRQLILRMLNISATDVTAALAGLSGIVDEFDIKPAKGLYGWSTRHLVIARKITDYKFSHIDELTGLFDQVIDNINPAETIELQSVRAICDTEYGIGRIGDPPTRQRLYRKLIELVPGERIPWHRLIREKLEEKEVNDVEYLIREAADAVGADAPIDRYRVRLLVVRAKSTKGISDSDRLALLRRAFELALVNIGRHDMDKFSYREACNVALDLHGQGESAAYLDEAIALMRNASELIGDPDMDRMLQGFEHTRARLNR